MSNIADLRYLTYQAFDAVNFSELNESWVDQVVENEFTGAEENPITISLLFVNSVIPSLSQLSNICKEWIYLSLTQELSSGEEALWTVLQEMDVYIKQVQGLLYLLCSRAKKNSASLDDKACALAAAEFYFNFLSVPGSSAYAAFHVNLFFLCIDCMPAPDLLTDKDHVSAREFEKIAQFTIPALLSLEKLLRNVHIARDSHVVEYAIKKLIDMAACEVQSLIKFENISDEYEPRNQKGTSTIARLSFKALLATLEAELNGNPAQNYMYICLQLSKNILCFRAKKNPTISQKYHVVKENCILFIRHNLMNKTLEEFCSEVTLVLLKRLCLGVIDKADFRSAACNAVVSVMFCMKTTDLAEMVQWLLQLVDSVDTKDRVFALEVHGVLLNQTFPAEIDPLPDSVKVYLSEMPIIFAILTRCEDTSPNVRTKALTVLSQNMKRILEFLDKTKDRETFETELSDEINDKDLEVNGNHRFFWYHLKSLRERLNEIANFLRRRVEDYNVTARKAALVALENLIVFDKMYLSAENLKFFDFSAKDANIVVRKQVMVSLSTILDTYHDQAVIQRCWLRCILPLVQDPENSVQAKAISALEEQFLQKIFSSSETNQKCSFSVLQIATSGEFSAYQRYLRKAFGAWKAEKKLRPQLVLQLEKYMDSEWEESVWFYLSNFSAHCTLPPQISHTCFIQFQKLMQNGSFPSHLKFMLKLLQNMFKSLPMHSHTVIKDLIEKNLNELVVPVNLVPTYLAVLFKSFDHLKINSEFKKFSCDLLLKCEMHLTEIQSNPSFSSGADAEELLGKCFCVIKELCQLDESLISSKVITLLKTYAACIKPPDSALLKILTPCIRAQAFSALGKICLQHEILAKELLSVYAQVLLTSSSDVIRNNIVIILIEMCKRYTSFADRYIPLISLCLKDRLFLIRYQTVKLLLNLLQEGYIKWRGALFFCLLSTLNDKKEEIQELGRYSLSSLLTEKKKNLFSEHFVDSIFVFNGFPPPDNETLSKTVTELERFAIEGEGGREERLHLYKFLLESMDVKERAYLVKSICEILMNIAEAVYPLNQVSECIIRDCFAILTCKEIRAFNVEQISEDVDEAQEKEFSKTELETRRIVIVDPVIPVIVSLKAAVSDPASDLTHDIIVFLKELLLDFKDSLKDILGIDKLLLQTLELEMRNDAEKERAEKRCERDSRERRSQASGPTVHRDEVDMHGIKSMMNNVSDFFQAQAPGESTSSEPSPRRSNRSGLQNSNGCRISAIQSQTFPSTSLAETGDIRLFSSTPRVVLRPLKFPPACTSLNVSAIQKTDKPVILDDSDEEME